MKLTYTPEGADKLEWEFKPGRLQDVEAQAVEAVTGMFYGQAMSAALQGSVTCQKALLWVFMKRTHPTLRIDALTFYADEVSIDFSDSENLEILDTLEQAVARGDDLDEGDTAALNDLRERYPRVDPPVVAEEPVNLDEMDAGYVPEVPKAPSSPESNSAPSTSGTSPDTSDALPLSSTD